MRCSQCKWYINMGSGTGKGECFLPGEVKTLMEFHYGKAVDGRKKACEQALKKEKEDTNG